MITWKTRIDPAEPCLSVPGSSAKMIEKAKTLPADEVFLDLEDAVAPDAKAARTQVAVALAEPDGRPAARGAGQRLDDAVDLRRHHRGGVTAGTELDLIVLPKVTDVSHIHALDLLLSQLEATHGLPVGRIGIEAQIENAQGLTNVDAIAAGRGCRRWCWVRRTPDGQPQHAHPRGGRAARGLRRRRRHHHVLMRILSPPTHGIAAIDGRI